MDKKIYIIRFADGSYYWIYPTQICLREEDAQRMTWIEAKEIRDKNIRIGRECNIIEFV